MKSIFCSDGIENDRTDFSRIGTQEAKLVDFPTLPNMANWTLLFEPNGSSDHDSETKHF